MLGFKTSIWWNNPATRAWQNRRRCPHRVATQPDFQTQCHLCYPSLCKVFILKDFNIQIIYIFSCCSWQRKEKQNVKEYFWKKSSLFLNVVFCVNKWHVTPTSPCTFFNIINIVTHSIQKTLQIKWKQLQLGSIQNTVLTKKFFICGIVDLWRFVRYQTDPKLVGVTSLFIFRPIHF